MEQDPLGHIRSCFLAMLGHIEKLTLQESKLMIEYLVVSYGFSNDRGECIPDFGKGAIDNPFKILQ
jgi:hypothetical protein